MLEQSGVGYVLAVPKSQFSVGCPRIDALFAQAPAEAWERISCGDGAKGPRVYDWAAVQLPAVAEYDYQDGPRSAGGGRWPAAASAKPDEIAYYLAYAPPDTTVDAAGADRRDALGDRGVLPGREERVRPGPVRSPPLRRLDTGTSPWPCSPTPSWPRWRAAAASKGGCRNGSGTLVDLTVAGIRRLLAAGRSHGPRPPRCLPRAHALELVHLAPTTPGRRPPLSLPTPAAHDRGAVPGRPPLTDTSPLHSPRSLLIRQNVEVLLEY